MLNQRLEAARKVAEELIPAEGDLDNAILRASRLAIAVIEGRRQAKLPLNVGQDGLALMSRATTKMIDARGDVIDAHVAFKSAQEDIGLRSVSFGDVHESPDEKTAQLPGHIANVA